MSQSNVLISQIITVCAFLFYNKFRKADIFFIDKCILSCNSDKTYKQF